MLNFIKNFFLFLFLPFFFIEVQLILNSVSTPGAQQNDPSTNIHILIYTHKYIYTHVYVYIYFFFQVIVHHRSFEDTEYCCLCHIANLFCSSIPHYRVVSMLFLGQLISCDFFFPFSLLIWWITMIYLQI